MFFTLFLKECSQVLKSLIYYIYVFIFVLFMNSQFVSDIGDHQLTPPEPGQEFYGTTTSKDEKDIMEKTLPTLVRDVQAGSIATYPLGFYKGVNLSQQDREMIKGYIQECTGRDFDSVLRDRETHYSKFDSSIYEEYLRADATYRIPVKEGLSYQSFQDIMKKVTKMTGKGSAYDIDRLNGGVTVPMSYEEALADHEVLISKDKVTGAYARLFCDYAGIVLSLLPVFLGVSRAIKDRRMKSAEVIFSKVASGNTIIWSRYLANVVMMFLPVAVMSMILQQPILYRCATFGIKADPLGFLTYSVIWLLPEIMVVLALAFFVTEATNTIAAVFIQTAWAFGSLMTAATLVGNFGFQLVARWNTDGKSQMFQDQQESLFLNRGVFAALALVFVLLTVIVFEIKRRRGGVLYGKSHKASA